jgi:anti-anti-sigma factor
MTGLGFTIDRLAEPLTVRVDGEIDMHTAPDLRATVSEVLAEQAAITLRLDIGGVSFMDSSGLSAIIAVHKRLAAAAGRLVLARPTPMVRRMLAVTGLGAVLTVEDGDTTDTALASGAVSSDVIADSVIVGEGSARGDDVTSE